MPGRHLMVPRSRFDCLHRRRALAFDLGGGLGRRARETEGRQCEGEALHRASRAVVCLGPARHLGVPRLPQRSRLGGRLRRWEHPLASCQDLRGFCQFLLRVSPALANGQRITLHDLLGDMEAIGHAQAFQALFRKLDEGLGAGTDHRQPPGAQAREPFPDQRLPRGLGPIVCPRFQQEIARREVHTDQDHAFQPTFKDSD
jgi:hypothetical protein